jgi:amino acid transporter
VFDEPFARVAALASILVALTAISLSGMTNSIGGLAVGTLLKLSPIILLCGVAFASGGIATTFTLPRFGAFESAALLVYFAFSGANSSAFAAGELRNPRRDLPLTMLGSLGLIIMFYMAVQWAYIAAGAPQADGNTTPLAMAAEAVMGDYGALLLSIAAIFSIAANALAYSIAGPRVIFGMAERGLLPARLARVSSRFATPYGAILLFSAIISLMLASGAFTFLATMTSLGSQLVVICYVGAFGVLMRRTTDVHDGVLSLRWWPAMAIAAGFSVFTIVQAPASAFALLGGLLVIGTGLYFVARRGAVMGPTAELT